jgi:hypothetical protein
MDRGDSLAGVRLLDHMSPVPHGTP